MSSVIFSWTSSESSREVVYGNSYGELPSVSRTRYTFAGWYTEIEGGKEIKSEDVVKIVRTRPSMPTGPSTNTPSHSRWTVGVSASPSPRITTQKLYFLSPPRLDIPSIAGAVTLN